ncbi:type IX secretion system PorP/SprF family membrane protein [Lutibacter sp. Hel_I_33_5]|uniref:PorP/SprF family type IX secretion system membrane protein n=1 Tax=Lutibacter sp. Hel_I_33_5 TaxID=1566289 RepID=UPI00119D9826|nr:type IX secretion system membrane protein PorP/SprF [Lutibacter sp. Hel_I_33_5]TVZ55226.1 type IX secretion system PorP/SprF family membrane protein [Lutibacter sp. Hel_I_33_5]
MKIEKALLGLLILLSVSFYAQQDPQYTHYMYNMNIINPAYAGSNESMSINFLGRSQWVGIDGAPQTITFGIHSPTGKKLGLGLSFIADKIGPVKEQTAYGDFSFTVQVGEGRNLGFGIKAGFTFIDVNLSSIELLNNNTPTNFFNRINKAIPNFGAGVFYHTDKFYAGFSIPNMIKTIHLEGSNSAITRVSEEAHYFLTSGYVFDINRNVKFKPSFLVKTAPGAPTSIDLSSNILLNDKLEFGLSYRVNSSISALFNIKTTDNLRIGYAYDYSINNLGNFNSGSHEIFLLFDLPFSSDRILSPRFF